MESVVSGLGEQRLLRAHEAVEQSGRGADRGCETAREKITHDLNHELRRERAEGITVRHIA